MSVSVATVETGLAQRYMVQLCKHFAHKLPVALAETAGSIRFEAGLCLLSAGPERLELRIEAEDDAARVRLEGVVARHLERFAFRDPPVLAWQPAG